MSNKLATSIPRRSFLVGAAGLAGGALAGLLPTQALARAFKTADPPVVAFWDKDRTAFGPLAASQGATLEGSVRVTVRNFGDGGAIKAIDANFTVDGPRGTEVVPFHVWKASPGVRARARFVADAERGLSLTVYYGDGSESTMLKLGGAEQSNLQEGAYIVASRAANLTPYVLDLKQKASPLRKMDGTAAELPYILVEVARIG